MEVDPLNELEAGDGAEWREEDAVSPRGDEEAPFKRSYAELMDARQNSRMMLERWKTGLRQQKQAKSLTERARKEAIHQGISKQPTSIISDESSGRAPIEKVPAWTCEVWNAKIRPRGSFRRCGKWNAAGQARCARCGTYVHSKSAEIEARAAALLQTSDPQQTSLGQMLSRLERESGTPGSGIQITKAEFLAEVDRQCLIRAQLRDDAVKKLWEPTDYGGEPKDLRPHEGLQLRPEVQHFVAEERKSQLPAVAPENEQDSLDMPLYTEPAEKVLDTILGEYFLHHTSRKIRDDFLEAELLRGRPMDLRLEKQAAPKPVCRAIPPWTVFPLLHRLSKDANGPMKFWKGMRDRTDLRQAEEVWQTAAPIGHPDYGQYAAEQPVAHISSCGERSFRPWARDCDMLAGEEEGSVHSEVRQAFTGLTLRQRLAQPRKPKPWEVPGVPVEAAEVFAAAEKAGLRESVLAAAATETARQLQKQRILEPAEAAQGEREEESASDMS